MHQRIVKRPFMGSITLGLLVVGVSLGAVVSCSHKSRTAGGAGGSASVTGSLVSPASSPPLGPLNVQQAAQRGLKTMIARAKLDPAQYGFADASEVERATLGNSYSLLQLGAQALKQWGTAPQPSAPSLMPVDQRLYLVNVDNRAHAIIIVAKNAQGWTPIELGNKPVATNVANAVAKWPSAQSLVYVPSLHLYLLQATTPGPARFVPVQDVGQHKQGVEVPAQLLFETLYKRLPSGDLEGTDPIARPPF